nr:RNA-directed DNA polymerase, eukaryota [Tanacetum cinerariifolium]
MSSDPNYQWEDLLDIDDSNLSLTHVLRPCNRHVRETITITSTQNTDGIVQADEVEKKPVRIIPSPAGGVTDDILLSRMEVLKQLHDVQSLNNCDIMQKAKIRWAIEGDENYKYFHAIINKKRVNLSVKGVMVDGDWIDDPDLILDLESPISKDEIRTAVWGCGMDKSPRPDGFTFEFFRKYWAVVGPDFSTAVEWFFEHGDFAIGCNSSFVALIPKVLDPKVVSDYRPISLIGSLYKVVTKILAIRLSLVISDLISDVQTTFLPNRQILDGPFQHQ